MLDKSLICTPFVCCPSLAGMLVGNAGKRHASVAMDALAELFGTFLLPPRKLKALGQQPGLGLLPREDGALLAHPEAAQTLLLWRWEECLKER